MTSPVRPALSMATRWKFTGRASAFGASMRLSPISFAGTTTANIIAAGRKALTSLMPSLPAAPSSALKLIAISTGAP
jgi:hypothetical protein